MTVIVVRWVLFPVLWTHQVFYGGVSWAHALWGLTLVSLASTPEGSAVDRANEEKAPCEVLAMSRFPVAEHWDTAQAHCSLWGRWDAWYPVMHHINGREALVTLCTACNPEQGPSVTNRLSLKLQEISSPSRIELGTCLSSPLICASHMTLKKTSLHLQAFSSSNIK